MDEQIVQEIVDEILSSLEPLETQSAALLQLLKAKGMASDEELLPYLEQAGKASNVRWLAARVRIRSLISSAMKTEEETKLAEPQGETETAKSTPQKSESAAENQPETAQEETAEKEETKEETEDAPRDSEESKDDAQTKKPAPADAENDESKQRKKAVKSEEDAKGNAA